MIRWSILENVTSFKTEGMLCSKALERGCFQSFKRPSFPRQRKVQVYALGEKLQDWIQSPAQIITFGPRVTLGAILAAPERFSQLASDLEKVRDVLTGPSPANEKVNIILEEVELRVVDCLERGATVESDIYQNVRLLLPEDLRQNLPETFPLAPTPKPVVQSDEPVVYTSQSVAEEKKASEKTGLYDAIVNVKTAQSALKTNTSQAREKMLKLNLKEEREFLQNILSEIDVSGEEMESLIREANELLQETESMI